jgi:hypothetical protein
MQRRPVVSCCHGPPDDRLHGHGWEARPRPWLRLSDSLGGRGSAVPIWKVRGGSGGGGVHAGGFHPLPFGGMLPLNMLDGSNVL